MKTIIQIKQKIKRLQSRLRGCSVCENFGEKQIKELGDFVGDIFEYSYEERKIVVSLINDFSRFCYNFTDL